MTGSAADEDVLTSGRAEPPGGRRARPPVFGGWARRWNRLPPGTRRAASGAGIALVVLTAFGIQSYAQRPPTIPALSFTATALDDGGASMQLGAPSIAADATIVQLQLTVAATPGVTSTTITRLTGLGIGAAPIVPVLRTGDRARTTQVNVVVDCTLLTLPAQPADVRAHIEVTDGGRSAERDIGLGAAGAVWADEVTRLCSAHLAARALSVTSVTGVVDPHRPELDLVLNVSNSGRAPGWLRLPAVEDVDEVATAIEAAAPASQTTSVRTHLVLRRCPSWDQTRLPPDTSQTPFGLLATVGPDRAPPATDRPDPWLFGPIPLAPDAAATLKDLMVRACGGVASPVLLSEQPHASFDPVTRTLTTRLDAYLPPGHVRQVRFLPSASTAYPPLRPQLDGRWVVPDAAGVASATLSFHVPEGTLCFGGGPTLSLDLEALVPESGQERRVFFTLYSETFLVNRDLAVACQS